MPDTYQHEQSLGFNAGVMVIRPSRLTFQHLMGNLTLLPFDRACAEQSYLREYYKADVMLLPYKYNLNLAQDKHPDVWGRVWRDARVVHYTLEKPFRMESDRFRDQFALWYRARDEMAANGGKSTCA